jgi:hypothetical protein
MSVLPTLLQQLPPQLLDLFFLVGNFIQTSVFLAINFIIHRATELSIYLVNNIMWYVSKSQIYINKLTNIIHNFFNQNNITIDFIKNEEFYSHLQFNMVNNKLDTINMIQFKNNSTKLFKNTFKDNDNCYDHADKFLNVCSSKFDFYIVSKNNINYIEKTWKNISYIMNISREIVDFTFIPLFLEIKYPNMTPISFQLKTDKYNFLLVGNVFDKSFFNYFIENYYNEQLIDDYDNDTYELIVIDHNAKRHKFKETDFFTITKTVTTTENKVVQITYNIFN